MCASPCLTPPELVMAHGPRCFSICGALSPSIPPLDRPTNSNFLSRASWISRRARCMDLIGLPHIDCSSHFASHFRTPLPQSGELHQLQSTPHGPDWLATLCTTYTSTPLCRSRASCISCRARCTASLGWDPRGGGGSVSASSRPTRCWPAWGHCSSCWRGAGCRSPQGPSRECELIKCELMGALQQLLERSGLQVASGVIT